MSFPDAAESSLVSRGQPIASGRDNPVEFWMRSSLPGSIGLPDDEGVSPMLWRISGQAIPLDLIQPGPLALERSLKADRKEVGDLCGRRETPPSGLVLPESIRCRHVHVSCSYR